MFDVFTVFRLFGILPYRIVNYQPVLCPKWRYYSYIVASLVASLSVYRCSMYQQYTVDTQSSHCIFEFLLRWEPLFVFVNICFTYYTIFNTKSTKGALKIAKLLFELKAKKNSGSEKKVVWYTFITLVIILILVIVVYWIVDYYPGVTLIDYLIMYIFTAVITIQALQFCVYFEIICGALSDLEDAIKDTTDEKSIVCLLEILKLRYSINKLVQVYYPNTCFLLLNCLFYWILGFRVFFDLVTQSYRSVLGSLITIFWISFDIPLQFYLMHLGEVSNGMVSFIPVLSHFFKYLFIFSFLFSEYKLTIISFQKY